MDADKLKILDGTPLPDLITHLKHDAVAELVTILVELLRQQGFSFEDVLMGLAGYAHHQGLEKLRDYLSKPTTNTTRVNKNG